MQTTVKVAKSGQVSIPYEIRKSMGIEAGDFVIIDVVAIARKGTESQNPCKALA
jgi:AbrB family looped-hinge helix DNA binding protein